jgi:hypothetical protein
LGLEHMTLYLGRNSRARSYHVENARVISLNGGQTEGGPRFRSLVINGVASEDGVGVRTQELGYGGLKFHVDSCRS